MLIMAEFQIFTVIFIVYEGFSAIFIAVIS